MTVGEIFHVNLMDTDSHLYVIDYIAAFAACQRFKLSKYRFKLDFYDPGGVSDFIYDYQGVFGFISVLADSNIVFALAEHERAG